MQASKVNHAFSFRSPFFFRSHGQSQKKPSALHSMSWSDLPADILASIADRITEHADFARFRSVCPSWRSASAAHAARRRVPLLLIPTQNYSGVNRRFWSLADDSLTKIPVPAASGYSFLFASPRGWTLGVANDLSATLLHPFTGASESLPALPPSFHGDYQRILRDTVWDRSPDTVVVSPGNGAFFCRLRPVDGSWSPVAGCSQDKNRVGSITYCDGMFYLLDKHAHKVTAVDGATFAVAAAIKPPRMVMPNPWCVPESTLIASSAELLLIVRTTGGSYGSQILFKIFRADYRSLEAGWSEVAGDMGDRAVFVDHLRGFCVEANGVNGVRRNCVYVASSYEEVNDDYGLDVWGRYTVSVLDLANLTTQDLSYGNLLKCLCGRFWQWPSWSMPNLH